MLDAPELAPPVEALELALAAPTTAVESVDLVATGAMLDAPEVAPPIEALELALPAPTTAVESGDLVTTGAILDALTEAAPAPAAPPPRYTYSFTPSSRVPK